LPLGEQVTDAIPDKLEISFSTRKLVLEIKLFAIEWENNIDKTSIVVYNIQLITLSLLKYIVITNNNAVDTLSHQRHFLLFN
jgi:hypothetical protein